MAARALLFAPTSTRGAAYWIMRYALDGRTDSVSGFNSSADNVFAQGVQLSATGTGPTKTLGCSIVLQSGQLERLLRVLKGDGIEARSYCPEIKYVVLNTVDRIGTVLHSNVSGISEAAANISWTSVLTALGLSVINQSPVYTSSVAVTGAITLTSGQSYDLNGRRFYRFPEFSGPLFIMAGDNCRIYCSKGTGVIDDTGITPRSPITANAGTSGGIIEDIQFLGTKTLSVRGGNRLAQTGGGNIVRDCFFWRAQYAVELCGMAPTASGLSFLDCPYSGLHIGAVDLSGSISDPDWHQANDALVSYCYFANCQTANPGDTDYYTFYAQRSLTGNYTADHLRFFGNHGSAYYLDEGYSNVDSDDVLHFMNKGRDARIGGGKRIVLTDWHSRDAAYRSSWDDRFAPSSHYYGGLGDAHGVFHSSPWTHGAYSGAVGNSQILAEHTQINDPGASAWLAKVDPEYTSDWTNEATWSSTGTLEYTYAGSTPEPQVLPPSIISTIEPSS